MSFTRAERFPHNSKKKKQSPTLNRSVRIKDTEAHNFNRTYPPSGDAHVDSPSARYLSYLEYLETEIDKGFIPTFEAFEEERGRQRERRKKTKKRCEQENLGTSLSLLRRKSVAEDGNLLTFRMGGSGEGFARYVEGLYQHPSGTGCHHTNTYNVRTCI
jgi:hypothetical protein